MTQCGTDLTRCAVGWPALSPDKMTVAAAPVANVCPSTGPAKKFGSGYQPRGHGVVFDVVFGFGKLRGIADPTVPGFVFPKWLASAAENPVSLPSGRALEPTGDCRQGNQRCQEHVDVIGHQYPCMELIESAFSRAIHKLVCHHLCNSRVRQPLRPLLFSIQFSIFDHKRVARCRIRLQQISRLHFGTEPHRRQFRNIAMPSVCRCGRFLR